MFMKVSSPGVDLADSDVDRIEQDLEKIDRRLKKYDDVYLEVRVGHESEATTSAVTLELDYGPNHLVATSQGADLGQALRDARDDLLRQINKGQRGSHSDYSKHA